MIDGSVNSRDRKLTGCVFYERCPKAMDICRDVSPRVKFLDSQKVRCHLYDEIGEEGAF